ncbi:hypothetical protein BAE44_0015361 [Dichanthelium oligosanthes]|uniref:Uncharacterized protein n=1 Tax=Dichanthelium oligosanthes TaxID=888268 RepID=A0A1E5VEQ8_9POAL|nr:hypothetical protein BAE44_0015361 [Dichanthelium oligosanthes]
MSGMLIFLHLLLLSSATAAAAAAATQLPPDANNNAQGWAAARRLLLRQPSVATATSTFHVKGGEHEPAATTASQAVSAKPNVEFNASAKSSPGSRFNPRQN